MQEKPRESTRLGPGAARCDPEPLRGGAVPSPPGFRRPQGPDPRVLWHPPCVLRGAVRNGAEAMAIVDGPKLCNRRVLVAEDDPAIREVLLHALRDQGWEVEGVTDGLQALARLRHDDFDVVITDLEMPSLGGLDLMHEVRQMGCGLPVVVHSGHIDPATEDRLRRAGAFRVVVKGAPLEDLIRSVEEACRACDDEQVRFA